jgi:hypothetical protein
MQPAPAELELLTIAVYFATLCGTPNFSDLLLVQGSLLVHKIDSSVMKQ